MKTENLIVFCLECGGHFKVGETYPIKVEHEGPAIKDNLHICKECYETLPETDEIKKWKW